MTKTIDVIISQLALGLAPMDALLLFLLMFTRWLVMSIMMPILGAQLLPAPVRIGLAGLMSVLSFILLAKTTVFPTDPTIFYIVALFLKEALIGFIIGFFTSLLFFAYELFGELIDFARAASMSKMLVPEFKHQSSSMGVFLFQLALAIFLGAGFHREVIRGAFTSFEKFPATSFSTPFLNTNFYGLCVDILGTLFKVALRLSLPVILTCFLIDLAFGLMNRVAPQINAYFLSLPAKIIGGLIMVFFLLPFLMMDFEEQFRGFSRFFQSLVNQ